MQYLLDANIIIDAKQRYYQIARIPEFWEWLNYHMDNDNIKIPSEVFAEIVVDKGDDLYDWLKKESVKEVIQLNDSLRREDISHVIKSGYGLDSPTEVDMRTMGNDPALISYALTHKDLRCIVTSETRKPSLQGANKKIPDVCDFLKIKCCNTVDLINALDFKTANF